MSVIIFLNHVKKKNSINYVFVSSHFVVSAQQQCWLRPHALLIGCDLSLIFLHLVLSSGVDRQIACH